MPHLQVCELGSEQIWFYYRWFQYSHHFVLWLLLKPDFNIPMSLLFILWSIERLYFWVLLIILIVRLIANKVMRMWVIDRLRCELVIGRRKVMRMVMWWVEGRKKERGIKTKIWGLKELDKNRNGWWRWNRTEKESLLRERISFLEEEHRIETWFSF